ncbi:hypothetical protein OG563_36750 [Nocardia vinacea]|uniref:DUF6602 domain-containing protein n=1 Tax=Nocardia vinacea TaxID=96468 RepID=A0ABZ1YNK6_9NOCA|nr:DUF6602 domain-containing protein [Nocardia vinacea]
MNHEHHEWLKDVSRQMASDYVKAHAMASNPSNVQHSGHKSESAWVRPLQDWLPPQFQVATRKYLLLEDDSLGPAMSAETDIVIFQPSYPERLRDRDEVLVAGVAAAFSVKLTLDRKGIEEAVTEAATVRRATKIRSNTVRGEVLPPFLYGLLAHSHAWKQPGSTPDKNVTEALIALDREHSEAPREGLDLVCVADHGCWSRVTTIMDYPEPGSPQAHFSPYGGVESGFVADVEPDDVVDENLRYPPIATLISILLDKLSYYDASVKPIADGLRLTSPDVYRDGELRHWELASALSSDAREELTKSPWTWEPVYT